MTTTQLDAQKSVYIAVQDTVTGAVTAVAFPEDVQIGLPGSPGELSLTGRLTLTTNGGNAVSSSYYPGRVISLTNDDLVIGVATPGDGITTYIDLPPSPAEGQLIFVKDVGNYAATDTITIRPGDSSQTIDFASVKTITTNLGIVALCWITDQWYVVGTNGTGGGGGAPTNAKYIVVDYDGTLSDERKLAVAASLSLTDAGANSTITLDLATQAGVVAGPYTNANITVNSKGIVTAVANGASGGAPTNATYVVMTANGTLTDERILTNGTGLTKTDAGAGGNVTLAIDNNVVATVSGTTFTGITKHNSGLSGSLTQLVNGTSYLVAGTNISIASASNGQVTITSTATSGGADQEAQYVVMAATASLPNERALAAGTGLTKTDGGAGGSVTLAIDDNIIATVSGTTFTGVTKHNSGLSGSLTQLTNGTSYLVAGTLVTITSASNGQVTIASTAAGADQEAQYVVMAATASLPNERALAAGTGITRTDAGAGGNVTLAIDNNVVATVSGTTFTGVTKHSMGLSGSLTQLTSGVSYLAAGSNITITTGSTGQVTIAGAAQTTYADLDAQYIVIAATSSLPNERALAAGTGLTRTDAGAGSNVTLAIDNNVVATISGSIFTGPVIFSSGLSGSLTRLSNGTSYLQAGPNITINTGSGGWVEITGSAGGSGITSVYYGFTTGSLTFSASNWSNFTDVVTYMSDVVNTNGITRTDSTITVSHTGLYNFHSSFNSFGNNEYITWRLSGSTGTLLQRTSFVGTPAQHPSSLDGVVSLSAGSSVVLQYLVLSGSSGSWDASDPVGTSPQTENMRTGEISMFLFSAGSNQVVTGTWYDATNCYITTGSVSIDSQNRTTSQLGADNYFYVSGTMGLSGSSTGKISVFGGDVRVSGSLTVGTGSVIITSNDIQFSTTGTKIEKSGNDLKFYDSNNLSGKTLTSLIPATSPWTTVFDIDFTTQASCSFTSDGVVTIAGYTWTLENMANADSIGVLPGVGLIIDPNANASDTYTTTYNTPSIILPITNSLPNFNLFDYSLRLWMVCEITGANQNYEHFKGGFAKYKLVNGGTKYWAFWAKGWQDNARAYGHFIGNSAAATMPTALTSIDNNFLMIEWNNLYHTNYYYATKDVANTFDDVRSSMMFHDSYIVAGGMLDGGSLYAITGSGDLSIHLSCYPVNTSNSVSATVRRLRLEYKLK